MVYVIVLLAVGVNFLVFALGILIGFELGRVKNEEEES